MIEKGREQKLYNTVWAGVDEDTAPTGYTASITNNGTFDATSTAGQIRFTCAAATDRGYLQFSTSFTDNGIFAISVFVETAHIACRVGSVVGAGGGNQTTIGYFEDGVEVNVTDNVQSGKRYTYVFNKTSGTSYARFGIGVDAGRAGDLTLAQPQFEIGIAATDYIENTSTTTTKDAGILEDEPRFDYTGGGCPGLLLEDQSINLVRYSEYFGDYTETNTTISDTLETSPEGVKNAYKVLETSATNASHKFVTTGILLESYTNGNSYSVSVFAKAAGRTKFRLQAGTTATEFPFKLQTLLLLVTAPPSAATGNDSNANVSIEKYENGWYRCKIEGFTIDLDEGTGTGYKKKYLFAGR